MSQCCYVSPASLRITLSCLSLTNNDVMFIPTTVIVILSETGYTVGLLHTRIDYSLCEVDVKRPLVHVVIRYVGLHVMRKRFAQKFVHLLAHGPKFHVDFFKVTLHIRN